MLGLLLPLCQAGILSPLLRAGGCSHSPISCPQGPISAVLWVPQLLHLPLTPVSSAGCTSSQGCRQEDLILVPSSRSAHAGGFWSYSVPMSSPINLPPPWVLPLLAGLHPGEDPSISEVPNKAAGAQARPHFPEPSPGCWVPVWMLSSYLMGLLARGGGGGGERKH